MDDAPVRAGDLLAGKYRVERVLGSGGMGVVVAAQHIELGQRVALKFLLPSALHNGEAASRFLREARAAVQIESEHVARVLDVGRLEDGAPYLVMEYLEGSDLANLAHGEALPVETAVDFVLQACEAMAVAHSIGIVHRDLKPANLFLTRRPDGSPLLKVLDFGISKMSLMESSAVLTQATAFMGSPLYMSPEQARSASTVDARTDIWSLGVILYELLTGGPPFMGETLTEVIALLVTATPKPIREIRPSVPVELERAVLRALEKPLDRRYANIGEFSAALVEFGSPHSRMLHERVSGVLTRAGVLSSTEPSHTPARPGSAPAEARSGVEGQSRVPRVAETDANWMQGPKPGLNRTRVSVLVLGALLATVAGVWFWMQRPQPVTHETPQDAAPSAAYGAASTPALPLVTAPEPAPAIPSVPSANPAPSAGHPPLEGSLESKSAKDSAQAAREPVRKVKTRAPKPVNTSPSREAPPPRPAAPPTKKNPLAIDFK